MFARVFPRWMAEAAVSGGKEVDPTPASAMSPTGRPGLPGGRAPPHSWDRENNPAGCGLKLLSAPGSRSLLVRPRLPVWADRFWPSSTRHHRRLRWSIRERAMAGTVALEGHAPPSGPPDGSSRSLAGIAAGPGIRPATCDTPCRSGHGPRRATERTAQRPTGRGSLASDPAGLGQTDLWRRRLAGTEAIYSPGRP